MVSKLKSAVLTTAAVLAVIYALNRIPVTRDLVAKALTPAA